jgi:hypothetical protein
MNDTWKTAGMLAESLEAKGKVEGRRNNVRNGDNAKGEGKKKSKEGKETGKRRMKQGKRMKN